MKVTSVAAITDLPSFVANGYLIVGAVGAGVICAIFLEKHLAIKGHVTAAKNINRAIKLSLPAGFGYACYKLLREVVL